LLEKQKKNRMNCIPPATANTLLALAGQFERGGTEELENPYRRQGGFVLKVDWWYFL
jgi:hypothetical protein